MELIDKADLVVRVEKLQSEIAEEKKLHEDNSMWYNGINHGFNLTKDILDTLEVKEVDLEKEIETHLKDCLDVKFPTTDIELIKKDVAYTAKKFFELGMSVSKQAMKDE